MKVDGFLGNGDSKVYKTNGYCVYLDKLEFDKNSNEIEVKVTVYGGVFQENKMFYLGSNEEKKHDEMIDFICLKYMIEKKKEVIAMRHYIINLLIILWFLN